MALSDLYYFYGNNLLDPTLGNLLNTFDKKYVTFRTPRVDLVETDTSYIVLSDMPGVDKKDITVTVDNSSLTISTSTNQEVSDTGKYLLRERYSSTCSRMVNLPRRVIPTSQVTSKLENGVLTVTIEKPQQTAARSVVVE